MTRQPKLRARSARRKKEAEGGKGAKLSGDDAVMILVVAASTKIMMTKMVAMISIMSE
jgi:hypothetical protein